MKLPDKITKLVEEGQGGRYELPDWIKAEIDAGTLTLQKLDAAEKRIKPCAACQGMRYVHYEVEVGHPSFGKMYPCPECRGGKELIDRAVKLRIDQTELPKGYQGLTFDSWEQLSDDERKGKTLALACAKLFVQSETHAVSLEEAYRLCGRELGGVNAVRNSLVFQGPPGLGKTGLAAAVVNALLAEHKSVLYIRTQDFVEAVKQSFDKGKNGGMETSQSIIDTVKRHPRLVMDEFNMSVTGEWRQEVIENVIRYRYGNGLPTIITCNANMDELEAQWGIRVTSVLFTMAHLVPMGGHVLRDMRQNEEAF